ncbi:MoaD family protein [Dehalococcoidia bacterium]|nr:MoaD family protein [Dehalococcoidia bacterium]
MGSAIIRIPTPLRRVTNGQETVDVNGDSLQDALNQLEAAFPGVMERIVDAASGELHRFVNIYINNEDVRFLQGLGTSLNDGDEVSIVPAVAGG